MTAHEHRILTAAGEVARVYRVGVTGELTKALAALVEAVEAATAAPEGRAA